MKLFYQAASPKRVKKVKKKKRKVKKKKPPQEATQDQVNIARDEKSSGVVSRLAEGSLMAMMSTAKNGEQANGEQANDELDDYPDGSTTWRQSGELEKEDEKAGDGDDESVYEDEDEEGSRQRNGDKQSNEVEENGMTTRQQSQQDNPGQRSGTSESVFDSGKSQNDDKELPPLDGSKLAHVQRRRLASNQGMWMLLWAFHMSRP